MSKKLSVIHFTFFIILFIGCATKTVPVYTVINIPYVKISDQGFLKESFNYKELVIYKDANIPIEISLYQNSICLNKKCVPKDKFIKKLSPDYSKNLLDNIIEKKPIENLGKIIQLKNGFLQKNERFFYLVTDKKVLFKDKLKKIIIMIKELN